MHLRDARREDAPTLVEFNRRLALESEHKVLDVDTLAKGVDRALSDPARGRYLVAVDDDAVIGQLLLTWEWSDWRNAWFWWIQSVYVDAAHRGRGVYSALHQRVVDDARARGDVCGVRLYVEPDNLRAQRTYERQGMLETYRVMEQSITSPGERP
jgi:GNAT superfamily N-acetyltransferase